MKYVTLYLISSAVMHPIFSDAGTPCVRNVVGNFLADMYAALHLIDCSVMLSTNHRSESQLIVDNSTRISMRQCPVIDHKQHFSQVTIAENTDGSHEYPEWGRWQHLYTPKRFFFS